MTQASFRAFHFVTDSVRVVRAFSRNGIAMRAVTRGLRQTRRYESMLRPTPGARVYRFENDALSGQALAGTGALVFEGETVR